MNRKFDKFSNELAKNLFISFILSMLNVSKLIVNNTKIKQPDSSFVRQVLKNIVTDPIEANRTRLVKKYCPKKWNEFSYFPYKNSTEKRGGYAYCLSNNLIDRHLNQIGTSWEEMVCVLIRRVLKKKKINFQESQDLNEMINNSNMNSVEHRPDILGIGYNRGSELRGYNKVFDFSQEFALKVLNDSFAEGVWTFKNQYNGLKTYYGNILLKNKYMSILRNVGKHTPAGRIIGKQSDKYYNNYLEEFSEVPQISFDNVALDLALLNNKYSKNGYWTSFDFENPNNILLKDGVLYLVDELDNTCSHCNTASEFAFMLLCQINPFQIINQYGDALPYAKIIFQKVMKASILARLPITKEENFKKERFEYILKCLGIKKPVESVITEFENINNIDDKNIRLDAVNKYLDTLLVCSL